MLLPQDAAGLFNSNLSKQGERPKVSWTRHKVRQGDSLSLIAQIYKTTIDQIKSVNELNNDTIRVNKYLVVPLAQQSEDYYSLSEVQREKNRLNTQKNSEKIIYQVIAGDSLWKVSNKFGTSVNNLVRWNQVNPNSFLSIGKKLVIWKVNKSKSDLVKITSTGIDINRDIFYTVRVGDSLSKIAERYKVKVQDIRTSNNLKKGDILQPGKKLTITINLVNSDLS